MVLFSVISPIFSFVKEWIIPTFLYTPHPKRVTRAFCSGDQDFPHLRKTNKQIQQAFAFKISPESQRFQSCFYWEKEVLLGLEEHRGERNLLSLALVWMVLKGMAVFLYSQVLLPFSHSSPGMAEPWIGWTVCSGRWAKALLLGSLGGSLHAATRLKKKS